MNGRKRQTDRPARLLIIWTMVVALVLSGLAFAYKIAEFMFTMSNPDFAGSFDVPIMVYFAIASGWLALLLWCFMTDKFKDMERAKYEMLAREDEYERLGV